METGEKYVLIQWINGNPVLDGSLYFDLKADLTMYVSMLPVVPLVKYTVIRIENGNDERHKPPGSDFVKETLRQLNSGEIQTELEVIRIPEPMPPVSPIIEQAELQFAMMDVPGFKLTRTAVFSKHRGQWFFNSWE